jgi:hypothetical protein
LINLFIILLIKIFLKISKILEKVFYIYCTSNASAKALTHSYSAPFKVLAYSANLKAISISGTPPPATIPLINNNNIFCKN